MPTQQACALSGKASAILLALGAMMHFRFDTGEFIH